MDLNEKVKTLEEQKGVLEEKLKALKIKQAQMLKIEQLTINISKLKSDIKTIQDEVIKVEEK